MEILLIIFLILLWILWKCYGYKKLNTISIDKRGYARNGYGRLVHRDIAYHHLYKEGYQNGIYTQRFGSYDIHHIDRNKLNNHPSNLQILTREEHREIHGR